MRVEFGQRVKYPSCCLYHCHCDIWLVCPALASTLFPCQSLPLFCRACVLPLSSVSLSLCSQRAVSTLDDDFLIYLHNRSGQKSLHYSLIRQSVRHEASCKLSGSGDQLSDQLPILRPGDPITKRCRVMSQFIYISGSTGCPSMEASIPGRMFSAVYLCRWCPVSNRMWEAVLRLCHR